MEPSPPEILNRELGAGSELREPQPPASTSWQYASHCQGKHNTPQPVAATEGRDLGIVHGAYQAVPKVVGGHELRAPVGQLHSQPSRTCHGLRPALLAHKAGPRPAPGRRRASHKVQKAVIPFQSATQCSLIHHRARTPPLGATLPIAGL